MRLVKFNPEAKVPDSLDKDQLEVFFNRYPDMFERVDCEVAIPPGWVGLVDALCMTLVNDGFKGKVRQIKSKFGGLRFYADDMTEKQFEAVRKAELASMMTCEECGLMSNNINPKGKTWLRTLCLNHSGKNKK